MSIERKLTIHLKHKHKIPILGLRGQLIEESRDDLMGVYNSIFDTSNEKIEKIAFSFGDVDHINSSGISILLDIIKDAESKNISVILCELNSHLAKVLNLIGILEIVTVYTDISEL